MASRWAIKEALYPPATQSIDDHIAEWPSYEERQEEEGTPVKLIVEHCYILASIMTSKPL